MHYDNIYGLCYYDFLISFLDDIKKIDIRAFHVLVDHKTLQGIRLKHLKDIGCLENVEMLLMQNDNLKRKILSVRNLVLKLLMTNEESISNTCKSLLEIAKADDEKLVRKILENLEHCIDS